MRSNSHARSRVLVGALLATVLIGATLLAGCGGASSTATTSPASAETTPGQFPATRPNPAQAPPPPMLREPRSAVYSYQLWISYAYRILNSDVASRTFSPYEEVRVNSYVELNRQEGRAIDQRLLKADVRSERSQGSTATVALREFWVYRYIDTKTGAYKTPVYNATYDTTYTVVKQKGDWVVESVQAQPVGGPVK